MMLGALSIKMPNPKHYVPVFFLFLLIIAPMFIKTAYYQHIIILFLFYAAMSSAWNIVGGFGGLLSFGHAAFLGIGAYTSTLLYIHLGISPWIGMFLGGILAAVVAGLAFYPCFTLRRFYFAMATLAFAEVIRLFFNYYMGETFGIGTFIPFKPSFQSCIFQSKIPYTYLFLMLLIAIVVTTYTIQKSRLGYFLLGIREDEDAATALGVKTSRCKLTATIISAFFTGIGGSLYAQYMLYLEPDIMFNVHFSMQFVIFSVFGGIGTIAGPLVGSVILVPLDMFLHSSLGHSFQGLGFFVYGVLLIIVILYFPQGILNYLRIIYDPIVTKMTVLIAKFKEQDQESAPSGLDEVRHMFRQDEGGDTFLNISNIRKSFGGLLAVKDVSFQLAKGEILGLIGPNGAGKTTLFNLITNFIKADSGSSNFFGEEISKLPAYEIARRGVCRTFQIVRQFSEITVLENVMIGGFVKSMATEKVKQDAETILRFVGLDRYKDYFASSLNISDRKKLEFARVLATKPKLILLDEMMAGMNPTEITAISNLIKAIAEMGITIILVEHVMKAVMPLCDRLIVLNHGEKIAEGSPQEIINNQNVIKAYLGRGFADASSR